MPTLTRDRIIVETFRYFHRWMPRRVFAKFKTILLRDHERWGKLGRLPRQLHGNPYWLLLSMGHGAQREAYLRGYWYEIDLNMLMDQYLKAGHVFIDIGANIGIYTLHGAYRVGDTGRVIAVEPNPIIFKVLQGHVAINRLRNVRLYNVALGREQGTLALKGCTDDTGYSTARPNFRLDREETRLEVPMETGDALLRDIPDDAVGLCKIDVEGMEQIVLEGMPVFLATHRHIIYNVEITDDWLQQMGGSAHALFDLFKAYGFAPYAIDTLQNGHHDPIDGPLDNAYQYNVLFKPLT